MAKKIEWTDNKTPDWKLCTVVDEQGVTRTDVSANRKEKSGTDNSAWFDLLMPGATVEGNLWQSPTSGKWALYPPKPQGAGQVRSSGAITKAMERKEESIKGFQASKEDSIRMSSTFRDATLLTVAGMGNPNSSFTLEDMKSGWTHWRKWLLEQYDKVDVADPFA